MSGADQGVFLDQYLRLKGPIPYSKAGRIAIELLKDLDVRQHNRQNTTIVIHPGCIRITGGTVELVELAELAVDAHLDNRLAPYLSPEELQGNRIDIRSTLYSLGCTLYELLTGMKPYPWEDPDEIRMAHVQAPIPDPRGLNAGIPASVSNLIRQLLAKKPSDRPESPMAVISIIQSALGMSSAQPPTSRPPPAPRSVKRAPSRSPAQKRHAPGERRAPGAAGTRGGRMGSRIRKQARGRAMAGRRPQHEEPMYDDYEEEDQTSRYALQKRKPLFTYCGIGLGIFICLFILIHAIRVKQKRPRMLQEERRIRTEMATQKSIANRKSPLTVYNEREQEAAKQLTMKLALSGNVDFRKNAIEQVIYDFHSTPSGRRLAEEWLKLHAMTRRGAPGMRARNPELDN